LAWLVKDEQESDALDPGMPPFLRTHVLEALGRKLRSDQLEQLALAMADAGYPRAAGIFTRRAKDVAPFEQPNQGNESAGAQALISRVRTESDPRVLLAIADVLDLAGKRSAAEEARRRARAANARVANARVATRPEPPLGDLLESLEPFDEVEADEVEGDEVESDEVDDNSSDPSADEVSDVGDVGQSGRRPAPADLAGGAALATEDNGANAVGSDSLEDSAAESTDDELLDEEALTPQQQADAAIAAVDELRWSGHDAE
jgi:hypothetical protein